MCTENGDKGLKKAIINLCGHNHTKNRFKDMDKGLIYHVEVDCHNMQLISIDDIIEEIIKKENE